MLYKIQDNKLVEATFDDVCDYLRSVLFKERLSSKPRIDNNIDNNGLTKPKRATDIYKGSVENLIKYEDLPSSLRDILPNTTFVDRTGKLLYKRSENSPIRWRRPRNPNEHFTEWSYPISGYGDVGVKDIKNILK